MNKKQLKYLQSCTHELKPIFQIGKDGIQENLIDGLDKALIAHELIKIRILKTISLSKSEIKEQLEECLDATVVMYVGNVICLYRKGKQNAYQI